MHTNGEEAPGASHILVWPLVNGEAIRNYLCSLHAHEIADRCGDRRLSRPVGCACSLDTLQKFPDKFYPAKQFGYRNCMSAKLQQ